MDACSVNQGACYRGKKWAVFFNAYPSSLSTGSLVFYQNFFQLEIVTLSMCVAVHI